MGLLKTADEKAAKQQAKDERAYWSSPQGQARRAYERGDQVFQVSIPVTKQTHAASILDTNAVDAQPEYLAQLNAVCAQGWELVNGDFVFMQTGQFTIAKQDTSVSGHVVGYYLFRRAQQNTM